MSPEQARGRSVDFRTDLYSLGIVVYEVLTGRVPFLGDSPVSTLLLQIEGEPPLQGPDAAAIPPALVPVLRKALAKNPEARYAGAGDMADAFRAAFAAAFPGRAPPTRPATERAGPTARGRTAWAGAAVFLAAGVGLGLWQTSRLASRPGPTDDSRAAAPAPLATPGSATLESVPPAVTSAPATSRPTRARPAPGPVTTTYEPRAGQYASPNETPNPTPSPGEVRAVEPGPRPVVPDPAPRAEEPGWLLVVVTPWAEVTVDGKPAGQTPLTRIPVLPGAHSVVLSHPDFLPYPRRVTLRAGEALKLVVNLETDGVRRKR
jgi:serine/threonine-protein kinase